ncbi:ANTAR domain-containing protein [Streptomyces aureocirculatus]|uniref:ANTAR domain-containing protein n=1 Tax=Streptomyces aureocirculatus TaxID=67275 RepID=UPI00068B7A7E|nr:ANTAR domain-containing protein [Streptomyces aureocirculatus]
MSREEKISATFVELADTLVDGFDVTDFLQQLTARCRSILAVAEAAVLLARPEAPLYNPVPCDSSPTLAAVLEAALREGPAVDAHHTCAAVAPGDLARAPDAWRGFTAQAAGAGYTYAPAVPLRLREDALGSLLLLRTGRSPLPAADLALAQAFAEAATIGLHHARALRLADTLNEQLQAALHSRILIEQAKGFLAARHGISPDNAFDTLRRHARRRRLPLTTVAQEVIDIPDLPRPPSVARHTDQGTPAE